MQGEEKNWDERKVTVPFASFSLNQMEVIYCPVIGK